jgi:hypothetical protein
MRYGAQEGCNNEECHNDEPLEGAAMVVWVPAGQSLDPVMPEYGDNPKDTCTQRDRGFYANSSF